ncbi:MAG: xylan 1 4-beta-xylosidase [Puniceicoccaceae bacterium 5H]|nr:MAG: xylan 1 4-beta-xylosidase [Puniceicoccaceae bacterium 5H]
MKPRHLPLFATLGLLTSTALAAPATFDWFEYRGTGDWFAPDVPEGHYQNPILAGFYPDPSITRVGDDYYLVNSTFCYFPGLPIFHSKDLVHWRQIGYALDRPDMLDFNGLRISRGIFAPAISYHDGLFYIITTAVDSGGNFIITAKDPAGPWSDPHYLDFGGIDPSLFFDDDGRAWVVNNDIPPNNEPLYDGHRAIWVQEYDLEQQAMVGPRKMIVNGGIDLSQQPVWIEGPHIFKKDGWYYLTCAEGGTSVNHSQVILRSRDIFGPWKPAERNPILTQRDLSPDRPHPITSAGHADLVELPDGSWWATFLACRPYEDDLYNTGRETFLLPVTWEDGWPMILPEGEPIPRTPERPNLQTGGVEPNVPLNGNFTWRDDFEGPELGLPWNMLRNPQRRWWHLNPEAGTLSLEPQAIGLDTLQNPSFLGRRQQHLSFEASTSLELPPKGTEAGMVAFQNAKHHFFLGVNSHDDGGATVFLERANGEAPAVVVSRELETVQGNQLDLQIRAENRTYTFAYRTDGGEWQDLSREDGALLSTHEAGGFVGAYLGLFARDE